MKKRLALSLLTIAALLAIYVGLPSAQTTTALNGRINVVVDITQGAALDLATSQFTLSRIFDQTIATGVGAGQANRLFADQRTLAASTSEDLDLAGVLVDAFGQTLTFARVKFIVVSAASANVNNVVLKPDATAGFLGPFGAVAHQLSIPPGGRVYLSAPSAAGWVVTATTADLLEFGNSGAGTSVTYDVIIVGGAT